MKKYTLFLINTVLISTLVLLGFIAASAQGKSLTSEIRPFDFSDKYYEENGIAAHLIGNRRNGNDGASVFDYAGDAIFNNVRITATLPAYDSVGNILYWNFYGDLYKNSFTNDARGGEAVNLAYAYPIYVFPSTTVKNSERQAAIINIDGAYFEKNKLGLGVVVLIEYTARISTKQGQDALAALAARNGTSLDGTPIIRTAKEIEDLMLRGLVTQKVRGADDASQSSFVIGKVIQNPESGAITADAFLLNVKKSDGAPLPSEKAFVDNFECLQKTGEPCSVIGVD
jgi:hypothetical protein